jgi:predicted DNA-binding transcriptional regulator AlpA
MIKHSAFSEEIQAERLLSEFFRRSNVGLAIFDEKLCYRMCNPYLAASNGTSIESHLGKHMREILGNVALQVETAVRLVFATAQPVLNCEVAGALPTKPDGGHWIDTFFPIADSNGMVTKVGAVVVELPKDIQLQAVQRNPVHPTVLRSWKDIAHFVGASVKTVQRWERTQDFPIRRVTPNKGSVVFALQEEIDGWLRSRNLHLQTALTNTLLRNERGKRH